MTGTLSPGFADAVGDAQSCFRLLLDVMARPGRVHAVKGVAPPSPLCDAAAAAVLTLIDHETPVWLDPDAAGARAWIAFHTGAPFVGEPARAMFALVLSLPGRSPSMPVALMMPGGLPIGTDESPESSATIILQVASLTTGRRFVLEGPGLRRPEVLTVDGLPADFVEIRRRNHALFPCGIDLILCAGNQLAGLPRGITVRDA